MTTEVIIANDIGTTRVKSMAVYVKQPGRLGRLEYAAVLGETKELFTPDPNLMSVQTDDGEWFLSDSVDTHNCTNIIYARGNEWALSEHYKALHLYSIAKHIGHHTETASVNLFTAVPRADWSKRDEIKEFLTGVHTVKIPERDKPLVVNIKVAYVAMQGIAAMTAEGYTSDGMFVWLGLGGRNKTYATVKDGFIDLDRTNSTEGGILDVIDKIRVKYEADLGIEMSIQKWIEAFENKEIILGSGPVDISKDVDEEKEKYVSGTYSLIDTMWNSSRIMPFVSDFRVGGGGALSVGNSIDKKYSVARIVEDPLWAEALGLINMGKAKVL